MTEWISVTERLPESNHHVLVSADEGVFRAYRDDYKTWFHYPQGQYSIDNYAFGVTHWMPLPKLPGEK